MHHSNDLTVRLTSGAHGPAFLSIPNVHRVLPASKSSSKAVFCRAQIWLGLSCFTAVQLATHATYCPGSISADGQIGELCNGDVDYCPARCCMDTPKGRRCIYCACTADPTTDAYDAYEPYCEAWLTASNKRQFCRAATLARSNNKGGPACVRTKMKDLMDAAGCGALCILLCTLRYTVLWRTKEHSTSVVL